MNNKKKGEIGERIAIGELAKYGIDVALPLTDNLPYDFIMIHKGRLFKTQVKTATPNNFVCEFDLTSNNWYTKTKSKYTEHEIDIMLLCDFKRVFVLSPKEFTNRYSFSIRYKTDKLKQKTQNMCEDYILSIKLIEKLLS